MCAPRDRGERDRGSAVVEFTLVGVLLTALFLALMQLGLALHVRNTLLASAAEGARFAAYARHVTSGVERVDGVATVYVQVEATLPVVAFLGPSRAIQVRGHALEEGQ